MLSNIESLITYVIIYTHQPIISLHYRARQFAVNQPCPFKQRLPLFPRSNTIITHRNALLKPTPSPSPPHPSARTNRVKLLLTVAATYVNAGQCRLEKAGEVLAPWSHRYSYLCYCKSTQVRKQDAIKASSSTNTYFLQPMCRNIHQQGRLSNGGQPSYLVCPRKRERGERWRRRRTAPLCIRRG